MFRVRALAIAVVLAVLLVSCGDDAEDPGAAPSPAASEGTSPEPSEEPTSEPTEPGEEAISFEVWLTSGDKLFVTSRQGTATKAVLRAALTHLFQGPSAAEEDAGVGSAIPAGTSLNDVSISGGVATIDVSGAYDDGGGSAGMFLRLAQLVYTATQFPSVDAVDLRIDGEDVATFSSEGIELSEPQRRKDYQDQLPAITVSEPSIGERVSSPVTISGTANTFEATVSIRIVTADGTKLVETFTTATCGTGCRGDYTERVKFDVSEETDATIWVFESSAEDGRPTKVVKIPVTLTP